MNSIETNVAGVRVNELWKQTATVADKLAICRSMTHGEAAHERGTHNMFTGYRPSPALSYPSMGSVVAHEFGPRHNLPPYVCVPNQPNEFAGTGYLSSSYAGFSLGADPASGDFRVRDLNLPGGVDPHSGWKGFLTVPSPRRKRITWQAGLTRDLGVVLL